MMRDGDIRGPLGKWIRAHYYGVPDTGLIEELKVPRPSARIDLALVNRELVGYEIKSDHDTLARLPKQIMAMQQTCDRACVVAARKHVPAVMEVVPNWCGVLQPYRWKGEVRFKSLREAAPVPVKFDFALAQMLTKSELLAIFEVFGFHEGQRSKRRSQLIDQLLHRLDSCELRHQIRSTLRRRQSCVAC